MENQYRGRDFKLRLGFVGSKTREELYLKIPFDIEFKVWSFNITNPVEVLNEAKPHIQDIGPYVLGKFYMNKNVENTKMCTNKNDLVND